MRVGMSSFMRAITYEAAANMSRVATTAHNLVAGAEDLFVGPNIESTISHNGTKRGKARAATPSSYRSRQRSGRKLNRQYYKPVLSDQPNGPVEGIQQAAEGVARRAKKVARTMVMIPVASFQKKGIGGAIKSGVRAVPVAVIEPIAMFTETMSRVTLGVRNWVDPAKRDDDRKKWKRPGPGVNA